MSKAILIFLQLIFVSTFIYAQVDPKIQWKKISLKNFELIYDSQHQQLAEIYATRLNQLTLKLSPYFEQIPEKTAVVLNDQTDLTNGYANVLPYPMIMIYPVLPSAGETIGTYGDWANEILTHEYTHILALYQKRGAVSGLENIFGSIMSPNILLPRWWHEGLAVEMETRHSSHGRLRSNILDGWLRSYTISGDIDHVYLDEANEIAHPEWPYGARPYFFGSLFWSDLAAQYPTAAKKLSWSHGGRFPYFIGSPFEELTRKDYESYFELTKQNAKIRAQKQIALLMRTPSPQSEEIILPEFIDIESPKISPDSLKLAFIAKDDAHQRSLQVLVRDSIDQPFTQQSLRKNALSGTDESPSSLKAPLPRLKNDGPPGGTITSFNWHPQSQKIVFNLVGEIKTYQQSSELWIYDLQTNKSEKIPHIIRAKDPSFSADGKYLAYVGIAAGKTDLRLYHFENQNSELLFSAELQNRVSNPVFYKNQIYFSYRNSGTEKLMLFDLHDRKAQQIKTDLSSPYIQSVFSEKLVILSDINGVQNAYLSDLKTHQPLSHTLTSLSGAALDTTTGDVYISELTPEGYQLRRTAKEQKNKLSYPLPISSRKAYEDRYPASSQPQVFSNQTAFTSEEYSPWSYLIPRYWLPFFYFNSNSSYFSLITSAQDPLSRHAWNFYMLYDLNYGKVGYDISYLNQTTDYPVFIDSSDQSIVFSNGQLQRSQLVYTQVSFPNTSLGTNWNFGIGGSWLVNSDASNQTTQGGPVAFATYKDFSQSGMQISPEAGQAGYLRVSSYLPINTSTVSYTKYDLSYLTYFSKYLPKHNAVMLKLQYSALDRYTSSLNYLFSQFQPTQVNSVYPAYVMRGYSNGTFQGKTFLQTTLEYRVPMYEIQKGSGTIPFYFRRLYGAFIIDGISIDGFAYDSISKVYRRSLPERSFWSTGFEVKLDTTIGYHFPMTVYAGIYYPIDQSITSGNQFSFGLFL